MTWKAPKIVEVPVGMEINMYACAAPRVSRRSAARKVSCRSRGLWMSFSLLGSPRFIFVRVFARRLRLPCRQKNKDKSGCRRDPPLPPALR